jgi:hypothetical protein
MFDKSNRIEVAMKNNKLFILLILIGLSMLACNMPTIIINPQPTPEVIIITTSPEATLAATSEPTATFEIPTSEPTDAPIENGTISGNICFPSEGIPPMNAYFEEANTHQVFSLAITQNQTEFSIDLPPGNYFATAWLPDFGYGGSYSAAVPCGLTVSCNDHSPILFTVWAGQTTSDIGICDWYGQPGDVPLPSLP